RGYEHYEVSNFSLPGRQCRHNLRYWRNQPYLGFGPAAHSFWENCRWGNERSLSRYCSRLRAGELPVAEKEELDRETLMKETVFLGLRLTKGVDLACFARRFGRNLEEVFSGPLKKLVRLGLVECEDGFLRLTAKGLPVANVVFAEFV
ncbi:MAG: coproporphyrinogen III oxidase, partial [Desulfotomaculales bacterium]